MSRSSLKVQITKSTCMIQVWDIGIGDIKIIKRKLLTNFLKPAADLENLSWYMKILKIKGVISIFFGVFNF